MRRLVILALLVGAMKLIEPLGRPDGLPEALLTFGFLILAAYASGELLASFGLPKIVGYLVAGITAGPGALNLVSEAGAGQLAPISGLAIALIAFLAGAELEWSELKARGMTLLRLTVAEIAVTFVLIVAALLAARSFIPFMADVPWPSAIVFAALFASIAVIHSPAVTMALLTETGARGPTARTTLGIVLVSDVVVVLFFSGMLALSQRLVPVAGEPVGGLGALVWEIVGAVPIGALLGLGVAQAMRVVKDDELLFALFAALLGQQVAALLHVEVLLTLLVAGFVTVNTARDGAGERIRHAMERAAAPIFVAFFALAGTKLDVVETGMLAPIVVPIVLIRMLGMKWGIRLGAGWAKIPPQEVEQVWKGLVPQAGVAFGLVAIAADAYPQAGSGMRTLLLAMIAINQTIGPILFKRALSASGEVTGHDTGGEEPEPPPPEAAAQAA
jgi:Kef-type K+ transport system membrane component KefB